jgi:ABC transporter with metal-binding/Fe-S-binding domain ATP-binding protein
VSLFSGGKDSSWALYRALELDLPVERLLTVHPQSESFMYHTPVTQLTELVAESVDITHIGVHPEDFEDGADAAENSGERGDRELEPMERALRTLKDDAGGLAGITAGAIESEYQTSRIQAMADRLDCQLFAPLWQRSPRDLADKMLNADFEIRLVQVAAAGLDQSWLGRTLNQETMVELERLNAEYGVHLLGEGGEFETFVVDGPHMDQRIIFEYEAVWQGDRGHIEVTNAYLE